MSHELAAETPGVDSPPGCGKVTNVMNLVLPSQNSRIAGNSARTRTPPEPRIPARALPPHQGG